VPHGRFSTPRDSLYCVWRTVRTVRTPTDRPAHSRAAHFARRDTTRHRTSLVLQKVMCEGRAQITLQRGCHCGHRFALRCAYKQCLLAAAPRGVLTCAHVGGQVDNTPSLVLALKSAARHSTSTSHCRRISHHIVCRIPSPVPLLYFLYFEQCNKEGVAVWRAVDWGGCYATGPHKIRYSRRRDRAGEGTRPLPVLWILKNTTFTLEMTVAVSVPWHLDRKGNRTVPLSTPPATPPSSPSNWTKGAGERLRCVFEHIQHIQELCFIPS
jgi:hypothetical protein